MLVVYRTPGARIHLNNDIPVVVNHTVTWYCNLQLKDCYWLKSFTLRWRHQYFSHTHLQDIQHCSCLELSYFLQLSGLLLTSKAAGAPLCGITFTPVTGEWWVYYCREFSSVYSLEWNRTIQEYSTKVNHATEHCASKSFLGSQVDTYWGEPERAPCSA